MQNQKPKPFSEPEFMEQAKPLWKQLFALAEKYNVPMISIACVGNDGTSYETAGCMRVNSEDGRTPLAYSVAGVFVHEGMDAGRAMVTQLSMAEIMAIVGGDGDKPDASEQSQQAAETPAPGSKLH